MEPTRKQDRYGYWKQLILQQEASGLSQAKFCKENNLVLSRFVYYRGLIKAQEKVNVDQCVFSEVILKKPELKSSLEIKITLPNGFQCMLPLDSNPSYVKQLLGVLLSC